jgi:hypothetical protein
MSVTISKFLERLTASRLFDDTDLDALQKEVAGEDGNRDRLKGQRVMY